MIELKFNREDCYIISEINGIFVNFMNFKLEEV